MNLRQHSTVKAISLLFCQAPVSESHSTNMKWTNGPSQIDCISRIDFLSWFCCCTLLECCKPYFHLCIPYAQRCSLENIFCKHWRETDKAKRISRNAGMVPTISEYLLWLISWLLLDDFRFEHCKQRVEPIPDIFGKTNDFNDIISSKFGALVGESHSKRTFQKTKQKFIIQFKNISFLLNFLWFINLCFSIFAGKRILCPASRDTENLLDLGTNWIWVRIIFQTWLFGWIIIIYYRKSFQDEWSNVKG